ncbi:MAG TPA: hypothetical protein VF174_11830 [Micromonosporaceae bacterium]
MASPVAQTGAGNVTTATQGSAQSITVAKPANLTDGDLMVAVVQAANGGGTWTTVPAGWDEVTVTSSGRTAGVWVKAIPSAAAETASDYTFSHTGAGNSRMGGLIVRVTGADLGAPVDAVGTWALALGATGVTTTRPDCLLLGAFWSFITGTSPVDLDPPGTMSEVGGWSVNPSSSTTHLLAAEDRPTPGATGARTATATPSGSSALSVLFAIAPPVEASAAITQETSVTASANMDIPASATIAQETAVTADGTVLAAVQDASATIAQQTAVVVAHPAQSRVLTGSGVWQPMTTYLLVDGSWEPMTEEEED